jgi:DNA primase
MDVNNQKLRDIASLIEEEKILKYQIQLNQAKKEIGDLLGMVVVK